MFPGLAKLAGNKQYALLPCGKWKTKGTFFCSRACFLINFDLVIPYFVPIHADFMSCIQQQSYKAMTDSLSSSFQFLLFFPLSSDLTLLSAIYINVNAPINVKPEGGGVGQPTGI